MNASSLIASSRGGHSARVTMRLLVDGLCFPIRQMGPDFLLVEHLVNHPPATASVELHVDESKRTWKVYLPEGLSASNHRVAIAAVA